MNVEELREYCLSLSEEVIEKFPFQQFKAACNILAFYIGGHIFCYFDINDPRHVTVKCNCDDIPSLLEQYDCLGRPYNGNAKHWISINATRAEPMLTQRLIANSFHLIQQRKQ